MGVWYGPLVIVAAIFRLMLAAHPGTPPEIGREIAQAIHDAAKRDRHPESLLVALAFNESGFDPAKVNKRTHCAGVMQIAPVHWRKKGIDPFPIRWNVLAGSWILRDYIDKCDGNVEYGISRYNGRGCVPSAWARGVLRLAATLDGKLTT